jgi:hypothetical protein
MKKLIFSLFLFPVAISGVFASADVIPPENIGNIVKLKFVRIERGEILEYLQEQTGILISNKGIFLPVKPNPFKK